MSEIDTSPEALRALADYWDNAEPAGLDPDNLDTVDKVLAESEAKMAATIQALRALAAEKEAAVPSGDGWIKWEGGECPVSRKTTIEVIYRDGLGPETGAPNLLEAVKGRADEWRWSHSGSGNDIVAYRVVEDA